MINNTAKGSMQLTGKYGTFYGSCGVIDASLAMICLCFYFDDGEGGCAG